MRSGDFAAISAAIHPPIEQPSDIDRVEVETIQQLEIDVGDIVDAIEPVRQAGPAKARVRGHDQTAPRRKQRDEFLFWIESLAPMQPKQRRALPGLEHFEVNSCNLDCCCFQAS